MLIDILATKLEVQKTTHFIAYYKIIKDIRKLQQKSPPAVSPSAGGGGG